ncbi:MAG TPA: PAS domain-containing sensor histidine kinase [Methanomassiliicoccales archaeon]|nr:PAS domain-containing sensor histidine kinase [Methanomassiliicoccales archaeon]
MSGPDKVASAIEGSGVSDRCQYDEVEDGFHNLIEHAPFPIVVTNVATSRLMFMNRRAQELFCKSEDQVAGFPAVDLYADPAERERVLELVKENGRATEFEVRLRRGNEVFWGQVTMDLGTFRGERALISAFNDITKRKEMEEELRRSRDEWEMTFDALPDRIAIIDRDYHIARTNKAMADTIGMTKETSIGLTCHSVVHGLDDCAPPICPHRKTLSDHLTHIEEIEEPRMGGTFIVSTSPIFGKEGELYGSVHVARDITDRKRMEQALRAANTKLNLLASINRHDLSNSLSVAIGFLHLAMTKSPDCGHSLELMKADASMKRMDSLLQFSRAYQEFGVKAPGWHDLGALFNKHASLIETKGIRLELPSDALEIYADPLLDRVVYNLLDNAARYATGAHVVGVSWKEDAEGVRIVVEDDGPGVAVNEKRMIFEKGFGKNTGMGLFLAREILSITGISITENGAPGKGARFELRVPQNGVRMKNR